MMIWHRRIGLIAIIFVLLLSCTGIALNHTEQLRLADRQVTWTWLSNWYGIEAPQPSNVWQLDTRWVMQIDEHVYLDQTTIAEFAESLIAVMTWENTLILASANRIDLHTLDGERIESITTELPGRLDSLGQSPDKAFLLLGTNQPRKLWMTSDLLSFTETALPVAHSNQPIALTEAPSELIAANRADYQAQLLNWERVMLDLHSGRLFGPAGPWLFDLSAIALIFMAISGYWLSRRRVAPGAIPPGQ